MNGRLSLPKGFHKLSIKTFGTRWTIVANSFTKDKIQGRIFDKWLNGLLWVQLSTQYYLLFTFVTTFFFITREEDSNLIRGQTRAPILTCFCWMVISCTCVLNAGGIHIHIPYREIVYLYLYQWSPQEELPSFTTECRTILKQFSKISTEQQLK